MIRLAKEKDISNLSDVRNSVRENKLSRPDRISWEEYQNYIHNKGQTWVYETENTIVGFASINYEKCNVWALFVTPEYENQGIGKKLLEELLLNFFSKSQKTLGLSTAPHTRAEGFYLKQGWKPNGTTPSGELKFSLSFHQWKTLSNQ